MRTEKQINELVQTLIHDLSLFNACIECDANVFISADKDDGFFIHQITIRCSGYREYKRQRIDIFDDYARGIDQFINIIKSVYMRYAGVKPEAVTDTMPYQKGSRNG